MILSSLLGSRNKRVSTVSSNRNCRARTEQFLSVIDHLAANPNVLTYHKIIFFFVCCHVFSISLLYQGNFCCCCQAPSVGYHEKFLRTKWKFKKKQNCSLFSIYFSLSSTCDTQSCFHTCRKQCFE